MDHSVPPGTTGLKLLGYVKGGNRERLAGWLRIRDDYGDFVYGSFGKWKFYLLNHPDFVQQALVTQADKVTRLELGKKIRPTPPDGILADKDSHRQ
mgnify:CR=1 FL=1